MGRRDTIKLLRNTLKDRFILPGDQGYDDARKASNAVIDTKLRSRSGWDKPSPYEIPLALLVGEGFMPSRSRSILNATSYDRSAAVIVRPGGAADVGAAVTFAREHGLEIAVKGGGHNVAGRGN